MSITVNSHGEYSIDGTCLPHLVTPSELDRKLSKRYGIPLDGWLLFENIKALIKLPNADGDRACERERIRRERRDNPPRRYKKLKLSHV